MHVPDPMQPYIPPAHIPNLVLPPASPVQIPNPVQPQLNWSHCKQKFSGGPEEDAEAHLLRTNDWMESHNFPEVAKVHGFCLTLTVDARLWYESLRPTVVNCTGLQEHFRQQYSKFGNLGEQLFHVWRSFHYDENVEKIDAYVNRIKLVAMLLNYDEPQILELFNNTLPSRLYWLLFSISNRYGKSSAEKGEDRQATFRPIRCYNSIYEGRRCAPF